MPTNDPKPHVPTVPPIPDRAAPPRGLGRALGCLVVLIVVGGAVAISYYWLTNRPKAKRRRPPAQATLVETRTIRVRAERVTVQALGTVVPARMMNVASRVGGEIVEVSPEFTPGGRFQAGDLMARIDPKDYELAVQQQKTEVARLAAAVEQRAAEVLQRASDVTRAESELALEMGRQTVAKRESELLGETILKEDEALVLRQPQLKAAEASCLAAKAAKKSAEGAGKAAKAAKAAAEVALEKAELNLARTSIRAPFNVVVQERRVNLGSQVGVGTALASLVGTDRCWIQVSIPVDHLRWISIPRVNGTTGSTVRVYHDAAWGPGVFREGTVERIMTSLEPQGRMARLLVAVEDPLALKAGGDQRHPLILGAYVRVEIVGRELPNCVKVPRSAVRDGNRVWLMAPDKTLQIRGLDIVWSSSDHVCVTEGLAEGDRLIVSDLATPVPGMALRTGDEPTSRPAGATSRPKRAGRGEGRP